MALKNVVLMYLEDSLCDNSRVSEKSYRFSFYIRYGYKILI